MKKTFQTLLAAVAVTGLSAGAALAAGDDTSSTMMEPNAPQASIESQTDASAQINAGNVPIDQVQASLRDEGYAVTVDGVWGPQSAEALRQFQTANNLDASGSLNAETLAALDVQADSGANR